MKFFINRNYLSWIVATIMCVGCLYNYYRYENQLDLAKSFESDKEFWYRKYHDKRKELQNFEHYISNGRTPKGYELTKVNSSFDKDSHLHG